LKKRNNMAEVSQPTKILIQRYQAWSQSLQPRVGVSTIHVDEVASRVASFYEKIRGVVEWKEEHLLRRAAIERILKRRLILQKIGKEVAEPFIYELIRGGHFPNDRIEETKIEEIKKVLDKYLFILENGPQPPREKLKVQLYDWLLGICACEIEEVLPPPLREKALIEYMAELMKERIEVIEGVVVRQGLSDQAKEIQIYIAVQRALFKLDSPIISYYLLKKRYPDWPALPVLTLKEIAPNIYSIWESIEKDLKHPLADKFYQICERYDTPYLILGDIISQNSSDSQKNLSQPEVLENLIRQSYQARLRKLKARMTRAAIYSTISIFITKILLALAVEVPFDKYVTDQFNYFTLGLNISLPPLLMFLLILSIRPPSKENLQKVIMGVMKIAYESERKDTYQIKPPPKRGLIMSAFLFIFYLLSFLISFGLIVWVLLELNFGILSIAIFLIFLSLILFAGTRIRHRAKELQVGEEKESILTFLFDFLTLPVVRAGKWLSSQWEKYNILVVLLNLLIELPFQFFVEFLEQLRYFWKEKKEEIH